MEKKIIHLAYSSLLKQYSTLLQMVASLQWCTTDEQTAQQSRAGPDNTGSSVAVRLSEEEIPLFCRSKSPRLSIRYLCVHYTAQAIPSSCCINQLEVRQSLHRQPQVSTFLVASTEQRTAAYDWNGDASVDAHLTPRVNFCFVQPT